MLRKPACALLFFGATHAVLAATLTPWVGKYPADKIANQTANALITQKLLDKKILPAAEARLIQQFALGDIVAREGEYTFFFKCKPHACPSNHLMIIEKDDGDLWVGIYQGSEGNISTRWYGSQDYTALPDTIQKSFIHGHTPR
jgi:hypothetical protein